jgi:LPPG:FO 2-phospho-L-lactate transferase
VVAVSPFVGGRSVKGPTEQFCSWAGIDLDAGGIARVYAGLADGVVADETVEGLPSLMTDTMMGDEEARRRVASEVVEFGLGL